MAGQPDWTAILHELRAVSDGIGLNACRVHALASIAGAFALAGDYEEASSCLDKAIGLLPAIRSDADKDFAFQAIIEARARFAQVGSDAHLLEDTKITLKVLTGEEARRSASTAIAMAMARIGGDLGDESLLAEAETALSGLGDPGTRIPLVREVVRSWIVNGNFERARALLARCEDFAREHERSTGGPALGPLVEALAECSIASRSPRLLQHAREILDEVQGSNLAAPVGPMCSFARAAHLLGDNAGAKERLEGAEELAFRIPEDKERALALCKISRAWSCIGEGTTARRILWDLEAIAGRIPDAHDRISVLMGVGRAWHEAGDATLGTESVRDALEVLSAIMDDQGLARGLDSILETAMSALQEAARPSGQNGPAIQFEEVTVVGEAEAPDGAAAPGTGALPDQARLEDIPSIVAELTASAEFRFGEPSRIDIEVMNNGNQPVELLDLSPEGPFDFGDLQLPAEPLPVGGRLGLPVWLTPRCRGEIPISFRILFADLNGGKHLYEDFGWIDSKDPAVPAIEYHRPVRIPTFGNIGRCGP